VVFPADWHGLILTRSYSKGKAGKINQITTRSADLCERLELATSAVTAPSLTFLALGILL
jgi:hypothetical protein